MTEAREARVLANKALDSVDIDADPDAAIVVLARQLLRADERIVDLYAALSEVMAVLRKEAPGTPLNNHRFDAVGIKANDALTKAAPFMTLITNCVSKKGKW